MRDLRPVVMLLTPYGPRLATFGKQGRTRRNRPKGDPMSTATIEAPKASKSSSSSTQRARLSVHTSQEPTEEAIAQLVHGSVSTLRSLLPTAVVRPTQTVELAFDVAEQFLAAARRLALEVAQAIESGVEGIEGYESNRSAA
jgi:hypothetical protein